MITLPGPTSGLETADAGHVLDQQSILAEQLARSAEVLRDREAQGQSSHRAGAVVRSLERTLARMAEAGGTRGSAETDFVIRALDGNEMELSRGRTKLPVDFRVLREALEDGGVHLIPGEAILADPDLARQVMEETLVQCSLRNSIFARRNHCFFATWRICRHDGNRSLLSVLYLGFWLGLSILFRSVGTSALAAIAFWIVTSFFVSFGSNLIAGVIAPVETAGDLEQRSRHERVAAAVNRSSPVSLYSEAAATLMDPYRKTTKTMVLVGPMEGMSMSRFKNPLEIPESVLVVAPYLVALTSVCFALAYWVFMRKEIRSI